MIMIECTSRELHHMLARRVETLRNVAENRRTDKAERQKLVREHAWDCTLVLQEIAKHAD